MVSDSELVSRVGEILKESDLETTTAASVRRRMEEDFGVDLYSRRAFIRLHIDQYLTTQQPQQDELNQEDELDSHNQRPAKKRRTEEVEKDAKKKGGGFSKPCALSPKLQELLGEPELGRTEVVKRIWAYIREKDLQNPKDRRKILCDEKLRGIFKVNSIDMFRMNKELSRHIWSIEEEKAVPVKSLQKEKPRKPVKKGSI